MVVYDKFFGSDWYKWSFPVIDDKQLTSSSKCNQTANSSCNIATISRGLYKVPNPALLNSSSSHTSSHNPPRHHPPSTRLPGPPPTVSLMDEFSSRYRHDQTQTLQPDSTSNSIHQDLGPYSRQYTAQQLHNRAQLRDANRQGVTRQCDQRHRLHQTCQNRHFILRQSLMPPGYPDPMNSYQRAAALNSRGHLTNYNTCHPAMTNNPFHWDPNYNNGGNSQQFVYSPSNVQQNDISYHITPSNIRQQCIRYPGNMLPNDHPFTTLGTPNPGRLPTIQTLPPNVNGALHTTNMYGDSRSSSRKNAYQANIQMVNYIGTANPGRLPTIHALPYNMHETLHTNPHVASRTSSRNNTDQPNIQMDHSNVGLNMLSPRSSPSPERDRGDHEPVGMKSLSPCPVTAPRKHDVILGVKLFVKTLPKAYKTVVDYFKAPKRVKLWSKNWSTQQSQEYPELKVPPSPIPSCTELPHRPECKCRQKPTGTISTQTDSDLPAIPAEQNTFLLDPKPRSPIQEQVQSMAHQPPLIINHREYVLGIPESQNHTTSKIAPRPKLYSRSSKYDLLKEAAKTSSPEREFVFENMRKRVMPSQRPPDGVAIAMTDSTQRSPTIRSSPERIPGPTNYTHSPNNFGSRNQSMSADFDKTQAGLMLDFSTDSSDYGTPLASPLVSDRKPPKQQIPVKPLNGRSSPNEQGFIPELQRAMSFVDVNMNEKKSKSPKRSSSAALITKKLAQHKTTKKTHVKRKKKRSATSCNMKVQKPPSLKKGTSFLRPVKEMPSSSSIRSPTLPTQMVSNLSCVSTKSLKPVRMQKPGPMKRQGSTLNSVKEVPSSSSIRSIALPSQVPSNYSCISTISVKSKAGLKPSLQKGVLHKKSSKDTGISQNATKKDMGILKQVKNMAPLPPGSKDSTSPIAKIQDKNILLTSSLLVLEANQEKLPEHNASCRQLIDTVKNALSVNPNEQTDQFPKSSENNTSILPDVYEKSLVNAQIHTTTTTRKHSQLASMERDYIQETKQVSEFSLKPDTTKAIHQSAATSGIPEPVTSGNPHRTAGANLITVPKSIIEHAHEPHGLEDTSIYNFSSEHTSSCNFIGDSKSVTGNIPGSKTTPVTTEVTDAKKHVVRPQNVRPLIAPAKFIFRVPEEDVDIPAKISESNMTSEWSIGHSALHHTTGGGDVIEQTQYDTTSSSDEHISKYLLSTIHQPAPSATQSNESKTSVNRSIRKLAKSSAKISKKARNAQHQGELPPSGKISQVTNCINVTDPPELNLNVQDVVRSYAYPMFYNPPTEKLNKLEMTNCVGSVNKRKVSPKRNTIEHCTSPVTMHKNDSPQKCEKVCSKRKKASKTKANSVPTMSLTVSKDIDVSLQRHAAKRSAYPIPYTNCLTKAWSTPTKYRKIPFSTIEKSPKRMDDTKKNWSPLQDTSINPKSSITTPTENDKCKVTKIIKRASKKEIKEQPNKVVAKLKQINNKSKIVSDETQAVKVSSLRGVFETPRSKLQKSRIPEIKVSGRKTSPFRSRSKESISQLKTSNNHREIGNSNVSSYSVDDRTQKDKLKFSRPPVFKHKIRGFWNSEEPGNSNQVTNPDATLSKLGRTRSDCKGSQSEVPSITFSAFCQGGPLKRSISAGKEQHAPTKTVLLRRTSSTTNMKSRLCVSMGAKRVVSVQDRPTNPPQPQSTFTADPLVNPAPTASCWKYAYFSDLLHTPHELKSSGARTPRQGKVKGNNSKKNIGK